MGKSIDQQLTAIAQGAYWTKSQFKKGELRTVMHDYDEMFRHKDGTSGPRSFLKGDVITTLQDDDLGDTVECFTRHGFGYLRRSFVVQYTSLDAEG